MYYCYTGSEVKMPQRPFDVLILRAFEQISRFYCKVTHVDDVVLTLYGLFSWLQYIHQYVQLIQGFHLRPDVSSSCFVFHVQYLDYQYLGVLLYLSELQPCPRNAGNDVSECSINNNFKNFLGGGMPFRSP